MLLRQYTRGKNGENLSLYPYYFLTLQRWQRFLNCANILQFFFIFFVKMPLGVFRCGGCSTAASTGTSNRRRPRHRREHRRRHRWRESPETSTAASYRWRRWLRRWRDGAFLGAFLGVFPVGRGIVPRSGVYPLKRRVFGVFRGVFPVLLQIPVQKNTGGNGGNHTGGDVGGILARVGGNREGLIFVVQVFFYTQKRPL